MNLVKKVFVVAAALAALSVSSSFAAGTNYGLGYFRPEAPVGGRVWFTNKVAADAGFGVSRVTPDQGDSQTGYVIDLGVPVVAAEAGSAKFFVRPGFTYASSPAPTTDDATNKATQFWVSASLGVEYFVTDHFSVQAAHGLVFKSVDPKSAGMKYTAIESEAFGLSNIGFHYYFGGK